MSETLAYGYSYAVIALATRKGRAKLNGRTERLAAAVIYLLLGNATPPLLAAAVTTFRVSN
ncbi:unnamed protein product [Cercospora beticola]|nr:unnamed protein product [Cercospora beticola]